MKQKQFEAQHAEAWLEIETILSKKSQRIEAFPSLYRRLCQCLALARQRGYSPALTDYLQKLVLDCHTILYGNAVERPATLRNWLLRDFPQRVRQEWRLLLLACVAFFGVGLAVGVLVWFHPHWAYSFMPADQLERIREMYQPSRVSFGRGGAEGDLEMFGFYIWNNVSIDFRTFAWGIVGGLGALFVVTLNGIILGVVGAWLSKDPATAETFWSFVITHASFEVVGMLLAGVAGMRLGLSLIRPGRLSRRHALHAASMRMLPVLIGATIMTVIAAFFEAFWSASSTIPVNVKYAVGAFCWLSIIAFFVFAGRTRR